MVFFIMLPVFVLAVECDKYGLNCTAEGNFSNGDIAVFAGNIIKALLSLLGVIVLIFMVYGGYLWMASGGNEQMVKKSKDILFNTIIGLIIVIAAFAITDFIMKGITGAVNSSESNSQCPIGTTYQCIDDVQLISCVEGSLDCVCSCQ